MSVRLRSTRSRARAANPLTGVPVGIGHRIRVFMFGMMVSCTTPALADSVLDSSTSTEMLAPSSTIESLLIEARDHNPEIAAAHAEGDAAEQRIAPAGALDDPMLEAGVVNVPLPVSFRSDDMTMKMLGLSQKLPFPGKRDLRRSVARADAASVSYAAGELVNRVSKDVRVAYEELRLAQTSQRLVNQTLVTMRQLVSMTEARYAVGQATQSDALQAQVGVVRLQQELLRLDQEQSMRQSELVRLLGRQGDISPIVPTPGVLLALPASPEALKAAAQDERPQLKALAALMDKSDQALALARREYYPDFEVRLGYGQREPTLQGVPRDDMITLTVAVNLPLWRKSRLDPRVAEARALQRQAISMAEDQRLETRAGIEQQLAIERQQRASALLYRSTSIPQANAAFESAFVAYRIGRVDFRTLLEAQMAVYETSLGEANAIAAHNKAIAELDLLVGRAPKTGAPEIQP
jgi:cobalt-zinc-cadmium efflux system outer membrane protein